MIKCLHKDCLIVRNLVRDRYHAYVSRILRRRRIDTLTEDLLYIGSIDHTVLLKALLVQAVL